MWNVRNLPSRPCPARQTHLQSHLRCPRILLKDTLTFQRKLTSDRESAIHTQSDDQIFLVERCTQSWVTSRSSKGCSPRLLARRMSSQAVRNTGWGHGGLGQIRCTDRSPDTFLQQGGRREEGGGWDMCARAPRVCMDGWPMRRSEEGRTKHLMESLALRARQPKATSR